MIDPAVRPDRTDAAARRTVERTGGPALCVACVEDGEISYVRAFGSDRREEQRDATPGTTFNIASVTKQFIAACALLLERDGLLSVDDPVERYVPGLCDGGRITLRNLLTHTSGYADYYPLGYPDEEKLHDTTPDEIVERYATRALQFEPGSSWSYSNTGFHILGRIIELVANAPLGEVLEERIFTPVGMPASFLNDPPRVTSTHAYGYSRFALGPIRRAAAECNGWMYAAGGIASTVEDLAAWCRALLDRSIFDDAIFGRMTEQFRLSNGTDAPTAMGLFVERHAGQRILLHSGGLSGFASQVVMMPEQGRAIVVLSNGDHVQVGLIARELFALSTGIPIPVQSEGAESLHVASLLEWTRRFQDGTADATRMTPPLRAYLTEERRSDAQRGLSALGSVVGARAVAGGERGAMSWLKARVEFSDGVADVLVRETGDGTLAELSAVPVP